MEKIGQIVTVAGDKAKIEVKRVSACGEKCGSCGGGCKSTGIYIDANNSMGAGPGQFVKVEMATNTVMKAAFMAYVFPLIMLIIGVILGSYIYPTLMLPLSSDSFSFILGLILMVLAYCVVRLFDNHYKSHGKINYKVTKILN